jgi:hypothetical protein
LSMQPETAAPATRSANSANAAMRSHFSCGEPSMVHDDASGWWQRPSEDPRIPLLDAPAEAHRPRRRRWPSRSRSRRRCGQRARGPHGSVHQGYRVCGSIGGLQPFPGYFSWGGGCGLARRCFTPSSSSLATDSTR